MDKYSRIKRTLAGGLREWGMRSRREENRVTVCSRGTTCSCATEEGGQGRLITVAFCGFVARHDPRAFRGLHCSAPNRSRNGVEQSYAVGEFPSYVKLVRARILVCAFCESPSSILYLKCRSQVQFTLKSYNFNLIYLFSGFLHQVE